MFSRILHRLTKENANVNESTIPVTPQVQGSTENHQGSTGETVAQPSLKRPAQDDSGSNPSKVPRFELETASFKQWELPTGLTEYLHKYMCQHVADKEIKEQVLVDNPIPSNIKRTPVLDNYIKELLLENKRSLTLNHEETLKCLQDKFGNVLGPLLRLWNIMEEEKEALINELGDEEDSSPVIAISALFEQSILLLGQAFNSTSYFRRKNILETLIDGKTKVKEILRDQSDLMNDPNNRYLFGEHFENEFSKNITAKQKSKALFTGLKPKSGYVTKAFPTNTNTLFHTKFPINYTQQRPFRGSPLQHRPRGRGQLFSRAFQRGGKDKFFFNSNRSVKSFECSGFSKCTSNDKMSFSNVSDSECPSSREIKIFCKELAKNYNRSINSKLCGRLQDSFGRGTNSEFSSTSSNNEGRGKSDCAKGNRGDAKKESNISGTGGTRTISELNLCSAKENVRFSTSNKLEKPKFVCRIQPFQNGRLISFERAARARRLPLQVGFEGCLFFGASTQGIPKVCEVSMENQTVPISLPLLRTSLSAQGLYKANESTHCYSKETEYIINSVSGRHSSDCKDRKGIDYSKGYIDFSITKPGFPNKYRQVSATTLPANRIFRDNGGLQGYDTNSSKGESDRNNNSVSLASIKGQSDSEGNNAISWEAKLLSGGSPASSTSLQISPKTANSRIFYSTEFRRKSLSDPRGQTGITLVDNKFGVKQWEIPSDIKTSDTNSIGCLYERLGGVLPRSENRGSMVQIGIKGTYKHSGTEGSKVCNFDIYKNVSTSQNNSFANGQCSSTDLHSKDGRYSQQSSVKLSQRNLGLPFAIRDHDYCRVSAGVTQCGSRSTVTVSKRFKRVETRPTNFRNHLPGTLETGHRSFCFKNFSPTTNLHILETRPFQQRDRCLPTILEKPERLCFSPLLSDRASTEKSAGGKVNNNFDYSSLARTTMVPKGTPNEHSQSSPTTQNRQSPSRTGERKTSSDKKQDIATSGLGSFREKLLAEGLSEKAVTLISNARRQGTISHYESSWRKWNCWCRQRGFDPIRCDLNPILEFLAELFTNGLAYNTICGYRSAISAYHDPIGPFSVGKHPRISSILTGIFNNRMPQPKYCFVWDVEVVLKYLDSLHTDKLELKMLTYKTTMLLALAESSRAHEICYLDTYYLTKHSSGYTFQFGKITKTVRRNKLRPPIKYKHFHTNENLCPCYHIDIYIEKTQNIRKGENQLLLATVSPHQAVTTQTVSRWLVDVLSLAGIDTSTFSGHSTRAASTSKAKSLGVPSKEILKKGNWSRTSTF